MTFTLDHFLPCWGLLEGSRFGQDGCIIGGNNSFLLFQICLFTYFDGGRFKGWRVMGIIRSFKSYVPHGQSPLQSCFTIAHCVASNTIALKHHLGFLIGGHSVDFLGMNAKQVKF